jgi:hypothetical protein
MRDGVIGGHTIIFDSVIAGIDVNNVIGHAVVFHGPAWETESVRAKSGTGILMVRFSVTESEAR